MSLKDNSLYSEKQFAKQHIKHRIFIWKAILFIAVFSFVHLNEGLLQTTENQLTWTFRRKPKAGEDK